MRVRGGARWSSHGFVLEAKLRGGESCSGVNQGHAISGPRFGFTVTKKIGNAVSRNRLRRRLKAAVGQVASPLGRDDCDYVLYARTGAVKLPYVELVRDLETAIGRVHAKLEAKKSAKSVSRGKN